MILDWNDLDAGAIAQGRDHVYLVLADSDQAGARLTRWRVAAEDACWQALRNTVMFPLGRGPGRPPGEPEMAALVLRLQQDCQRYENGERVDWVLLSPAWRKLDSYLELDEDLALGGEPFDVEAGLERVIRRWAADSRMDPSAVEATLARGRHALKQHGLLVQRGSLEDFCQGEPPIRQAYQVGPISDAAVEAEADAAGHRSSPEL